MSLSVAEQMAVAVLRGDVDAARALADHLLNELQAGAVRIKPTRKVTVTSDRIRVCLFFPLGTDVAGTLADDQNLQANVEAWLDSGQALVLVGATHMEVYEMPEDFARPLIQMAATHPLY